VDGAIAGNRGRAIVAARPSVGAAQLTVRPSIGQAWPYRGRLGHGPVTDWVCAVPTPDLPLIPEARQRGAAAGRGV